MIQADSGLMSVLLPTHPSSFAVMWSEGAVRSSFPELCFKWNFWPHGDPELGTAAAGLVIFFFIFFPSPDFFFAITESENLGLTA